MDVSQMKKEFKKLNREIKTSLLELGEDMPSEFAIDGAWRTVDKMARWEELRRELDAINALTQSEVE